MLEVTRGRDDQAHAVADANEIEARKSELSADDPMASALDVELKRIQGEIKGLESKGMALDGQTQSEIMRLKQIETSLNNALTTWNSVTDAQRQMLMMLVRSITCN